MFKLVEGIEFESIDNQVIAINTINGLFYNLNNMGYYIIFHLVEGEDIEAIAENLAENYKMDIEKMKETLVDFITMLEQKEILMRND